VKYHKNTGHVLDASKDANVKIIFKLILKKYDMECGLDSFGLG
jgi:hypothetical protein